MNAGIAVLPSSRAISVGTPATAFATIINRSAAASHGCGIALPSGIPATFSYQTTDPATNAPTGTPNTPVDIPAGGSQSFVFALTPTEPFAAMDVPFAFTCANQPPALIVQGLNTLRVTACSGGVPDIVVVAVTPSHDGVVWVSGQAAFAAAAVNIGARESDGSCSGLPPVVPGEDSRGFGFLLTAESGADVDLALCLTDPASGACGIPPNSVFALSMWPGEVRTVSVFVTARGDIPFDPARTRIKLTFVEQQVVWARGGRELIRVISGERGSASVAVTTP